jgi:hypothetical protein
MDAAHGQRVRRFFIRTGKIVKSRLAIKFAWSDQFDREYHEFLILRLVRRTPTARLPPTSCIGRLLQLYGRMRGAEGTL